jgi:hypothetical protein
MKAFPKNKLLSLGVMIIFLMGLTTCEKEPTEPGDVAPELPPVQSMQADLSFFKTTPNFTLNKTILSKHNYIAAAARVVVINTTVILASVVPTTVLAAALSQQPTLKEDGKWHWIFTAKEGLNTFSVDLAGWIDTPNVEVVWEVYISSNTHTPDLDHFLWYHGRSKIGNKEGWWIFHDDKSPDSLVEVIKVDWEIPDENESELIFSNVKLASNEYGDYLKYGIELTDRFLIYFDASENRTNTIYWNAETKAGYIEWFDYNDGVKSDWDENLEDTTGPPA